MADKTKMNKRQPKKLDAKQLAVLFGGGSGSGSRSGGGGRQAHTRPASSSPAPSSPAPRVPSGKAQTVSAPPARRLTHRTVTSPPSPASPALKAVGRTASPVRGPASSPAPPSPVAPPVAIASPAPSSLSSAPLSSASPAKPLTRALKADPLEWKANFARIARHSHTLLKGFSGRQQQISSPMTSAHIAGSFVELTGRMMSNPVQMLTAQTELWCRYMDLWQHSTRRFLQGHTGQPVSPPDPSDRRFKDPAWQDNPLFDYIKQSYLLTTRWLQNQVQDVKGIDATTRKKLDFYTRQFMDALSPSNFALTNPQVLRTTLETGGENLIKGLEHLLADMEAGRIRMTDETAFTVGTNLATTPGDVVFQNDLIQLIQYRPTTPAVAQVPLLIVPPWINKYYILDLKPENSFIKWAVDQGLTVFCISWVNPDAKLARLGFEDYMETGVLAAMDQVKKRCGVSALNAIGYCLGGTLLASTLAYLHATDPARARTVKSATYFVTLVDFSEPGELGVFIDDTQLEALEEQMSSTGYLDAVRMANTFNLLRANDLIWSFVVNNYLLGREPFPFDLLYWNGDSTRMPAAMHSFYLRNMYQHNRLAQPGGLKLKGVPIDLRRITTPSYLLSAREDHITPWESTYAGAHLYKGPVTFTLAGSGHIAGVINPPAANKYNFWTSDTLPASPKDWLSNATESVGSWWPHWRSWLDAHAGEKVPPRIPVRVLEPAPGSYVKVRAV